jgi:SAM-dependent methyltransferase
MERTNGFDKMASLSVLRMKCKVDALFLRQRYMRAVTKGGVFLVLSAICEFGRCIHFLLGSAGEAGSMREEFELNRQRWDEAVDIHSTGNVYGIDEFKAGMCRLHRVEVEEVGDVAGKSLLHLQCHFGLDTLSWARRGASVTGVDFSPKGVALAQQIGRETGVPGEFYCADVYDLPSVLKRPASFDIVYTSYGAINWLPDLPRWAETISHYLKPGGFFHIVEAHPTARIFPTNETDLKQAGSFRPWLGYFHDPAGIRWPADIDYANPNAIYTTATHEWQHTISDIVNSLINAGLTIEWLHEFPYCAWEVVAGSQVVERFSSSHAYYGLPKSQAQLPLMFSIRARKSHGD